MPLTRDHLRRIVAVAHERRLGFTDLVGLAELDPAEAFKGAIIVGNALEGQDLHGFDFSGADLSGATGLTPEMLAAMATDATTILPRAPSWAHDWGRDATGPWVSFRVPGSDVVQRMRWCGPGDFMMGSDEGEEGRYPDEGPRHKVTFAQGFWMFDTACTEALWIAVTGKPTATRRGPAFPVTEVSWHDAQAFVEQLNKLLPGLALSLPSEAQWEYACRAGTETPFSFGDSIDETQVNLKWRDPVEVASLPANPWGFYEMHGNVAEWCEDGWHDNYDDAPTDGSARPARGAATRAIRGGLWLDVARLARSAYRVGVVVPARRYAMLGFRCSRVQTSDKRPRSAGGAAAQADASEGAKARSAATRRGRGRRRPAGAEPGT